MTTQEQPAKSDLIRFLLEKEGRVMLCLDASRKGVDVPRRFVGDHGLRLVLNSRMPQPILVGEKEVKSELRFGGVPHYCVIPYSAIWGAFNPDTGHGCFWQEDMPPEVVAGFDTYGLEAEIPSGLRLQDTPPAKAAVTRLPGGGSGKPQFQVIAGGADQEGDGESVDPPTEPPPARRPHLRLVK